MTPQAPTPTLFPYTTLFRSYSETYNETAPAVSAATPSNGVTLVILVPIVFTILQPPLIVPKAIKKNDAKDRKSTRLNSSHVRISYAVFCLKKKKNNTELSYI